MKWLLIMAIHAQGAEVVAVVIGFITVNMMSM